MSDRQHSRSHATPAGRAIVTYSRGWQTLVAARSLGRRGVEVITGDEYRMTPASLSRYSVESFRYPSVTNEPEAFLDVLEEVVLRNQPADPNVPYVLMPVHKETYLIAKHRDRFEPHIRVPLPDIDAIDRVNDKGILANHAQARGLSIPPTWTPNDMADFVSKVDDMTLPAFVKLRKSAAGVGVARVETREELCATFLDFISRFKLLEGELPIVQAAVPGEDYCVTTLFDHGQLVATMTYHNLRAFPRDKGAGVMRETVVAPQLERIAVELLEPLGWHGVAQLDFRWDGTPEGQPHLIEVNPRFWGGLIQAVESGWDYPWLLFQLASEGAAEANGPRRYDVKTETPLLAFLATLDDISKRSDGLEVLEAAWRDAKISFAQGSSRVGLATLFEGAKQGLDPRARFHHACELLRQHRHNVYDILSSEDPLPALGVLYPLAVFLEHGKLNMELVTGEVAPRETCPSHG